MRRNYKNPLATSGTKPELANSKKQQDALDPAGACALLELLRTEPRGQDDPGKEGNMNLPNIEATSIRQLAGPECPTTPTPVR